MKNARSMAVAALMVLGTASIAHATRSMVKLENEGVTFKLFNVNDGSLYEATYSVDGVRCHITIDDQDELQRIIFGDEMYPIKYEALSTTVSTYPTVQAPVEAPSGWGSRQYDPWACDDCEDTFDFLVPTLNHEVCSSVYSRGLQDPNDLLSETATAALATFCDSFPSKSYTPPYADEVCDGQCESGDPNCVRALEVTLEWEGFGDMYLMIIEPTDDMGGFSTYADAPDLGRVESSGSWSYTGVIYGTESSGTSKDDTEDLGPRSLTYYLDSGLSPDEAVGDYEIWAQVAVSTAPISWKLSAEVNGEQVLSESGELEAYDVWNSVSPPPAPVSDRYTVTLDEYVDNDCSNTGS